jgi:cation diffusion facilitator CzcD-associated flavoprotein CzcO
MLDDDLVARVEDSGPSAAPDAAGMFESWLSGLAAALSSGEPDRLAPLFVRDAAWRDILSLTWARETVEGADRIGATLIPLAAAMGLDGLHRAARRTAPRFVRRSGRQVVEGWFDFVTRYGRGTGFARLLPGDDGAPARAWLFLTTLQMLHGNAERTGDNRSTGDEYSKLHSAANWKQQRDSAARFDDRDPQVLIVGAGQGGLMLAARLGQMDVDALVIDRGARVGDNWRARYNNLTIHNEITANHFPYLRFPDTWPTWLPKDMVGNWLEAYADFLELNVWTATEIVSAERDEGEQCWHVALRRGDGTERTMRVPHLVAAMGVSGGMPKRPALPGLDAFEGAVMHSGEFASGTEWQGKRALVVGTGNSGHDIAQDLHVSGAAQVAILQRGPTCVISLDPCARISYAIYNEGVDAEDVDLMTAALPYSMLIDSYRHITRRTDEIDRDLLTGLEKAGFRLHSGTDQTGFQLLYLRGAGGYYIDVGCSQLIIDGKVPVIQAEDTAAFEPGGLRMSDGSLLPLDLVILATGFESMQAGIRRMLGDDVADRLGPVWGFDEKFNMRNMWSRTPQDGLWLMGGAIIEARLNSRFLALEIAASLQKLLPSRDAMPMDCLARQARPGE